MPGPYPLATLGPTIDSAGISAPSYDDILASLKASMQSIYGSDIYLEADSQDGQLLAIVASAINDTNTQSIAIWNQFSPTYAQGAGLSSLVKLNGLQRLVPTASTAQVTLSGVVGTVISNGIVGDGTNNYALPATVTIGGGGTVIATATCSEPGAITAAPGTITQIVTPQLGWQAVTNAAAAAVGNPVESDATLRTRQSKSTSLPAQSALAGIQASIANLTGVTQVFGYENVGNVVDANGAPPHSIYLVVKGGTAQDIINAIGVKITLGAGTYGTTMGTYIDPVTQVPYAIYFFVAAPQIVAVHITVNSLTPAGVNSKVVAEIQNAISTYINSLGIGQPVQTNRLFTPAYLSGAADGQLYEVTVLQTNLNGGGFGTGDIAIAYNQIAASGAVTVTVTP